MNKEKEHFKELIERSLKSAKKIGANESCAEISEGRGLSVSVRKGNVETIEKSHDRMLNVVVFDGKKSGSASTSDFSFEAINKTVEAAWHIARYTAIDDASGLPDEILLAKKFRDFKLYHLWSKSVEEMISIAKQTEEAAINFSNSIVNTDGSFVSSGQSYSLLGNSFGFLGSRIYSQYSLSVVPIACGNKGNMQRDYWYDANSNPLNLSDPSYIGKYAAERAVARLSARRIATGNFPVIFEAPVALGLIGSFVQAASGGALYRKASFLTDTLGKHIFPKHVDIIEDPHIEGAMGSTSFDSEGVSTKMRSVVSSGVLNGYFLSSYSARKLGLITTGNAGGSHNLRMFSSKTKDNDDLKSMIKQMDKGLLITELIGHGINYVTGDYSRGAFGFWIENGEIQHAVEEITIAGNLMDMFKQIILIGSDVISRGTKTTGSVLIENMSIAGT
ncbi:PmbA protein [Candidatus Kinetoplastibacterium oncopeltii TCC290E]|uniref:PmbA protein n=1 Tax=Candidatus Kinetoplastidibacterium stringomonadis TCC290E TaxID=1208920 RepID=M1L7M4_9PROT|nr:metalloprotease PmbA [Candidatus Kinetoplastibacterium oncopeltii]AGF48588.1 PmbA protein [Candidatus Kinetoplastibacterium oncopeltii TCC290E]